MRLNVTFQTRLPFDIDSQPIGEAVAQDIAVKLRERGVEVAEPDNYEDYSWILESPNGPYMLVGYVGDGESEWLAQVHSSVGKLGQLFGKTDRPECERIAAALHAVLSGDNQTSSVRWHEGEFSETGWTEQP
jgi:hypothetical protein